MPAPINILIVDDEPKNLAVLESILDDPGYRLVRAESADKALLALLVDEFALLILDIRMPRMTGIELASLIKERKKNALVPIIFLTAYFNDDQHILAGYGSGAVDYLQKPVNTTILRSKVAVFAELHRKTRELAQANSSLLAEVAARRRAEAALRALTHRVVEAQEAERGHVALDLHDNITQMLCAIVMRSQALADRLSEQDEPSKKDALQLREMLGTAAGEVERISRNLRPAMLEHLGIEAVLRATSAEFAERTGLSVVLDCIGLRERLPINTEVAVFRILQEALNNLEQHAYASQVRLVLTQTDDAVQLTIKDDGVGFAPDLHDAKQCGGSSLGLLGMIERAAAVGGDLLIESAHGSGTEIKVLIPIHFLNNHTATL